MWIRALICALIAVTQSIAQEPELEWMVGYTGDKNAPTTIKTQYCKGTTIKCGKQMKIAHDGTVLFRANYKNGEYDGAVISYFPNGTLKESRTYTQGKEDGKRTVYYSNGKLANEQGYVLGSREGEGKKYYQNGILQAIFTFKNDRLDGIRKEFDRNGALQYETLYKDGKKQRMKKYDEQGKVIEDINCRWKACY